MAYGSVYKPLEWNLNYNRSINCYAKVVVNKADNDKIVGFHFLGPNAGEVTQGFAVAILKGITKEDLDYTVGIHPTMAEVAFVLLRSSPCSRPLLAALARRRLPADLERSSTVLLKGSPSAP